MRSEHRDAAAYELGVLDDAEEFESHLAGCPRCRDLLTGFHPVSAALAEAARLGYLPVGGSPGGGPPPSGGPPGSGGSAGAGSPDSPASGGPAAFGASSAGSPAPGGSARQRSGAAGPDYPPPSVGAARRRKPCVLTGRWGPAVVLLLALGVAVTVGCAARPATARTWFASAASIVSPAQVVAGTGHDLRDLPWSAGFQ
ncbi:zf-HC2 domain-containing protein [Amycolatopsis sp. RTGN1]|uniref:zf-HC2 domain-containing protein n=1 Tax=Amycolatopsis ponsaeliensis TaxID=2992142 RepID=UPI00254CCC1C|nr:zf-HC2 domain-containing protein [Amycolatopsis sp. RTGN1]